MALLMMLIMFALFLTSVNSQSSGRCQGATDGQYYLDDDPLHPAPRCCKCSMCEHYYHRMISSCKGPNNCVGKSAECWYEYDFNDYFTKTTTTPLMTTTQPPANTTVSVAQQMPATTRPLLESSAIQPAPQNFSPLLIVLIILCTIIILLLIFICKWCRKSSKSKVPCLRSTFLKFKNCIVTETKKENLELEKQEISESLIHEEKVIVSENGNSPANHCPSSEPSLYHSSSGPHGIQAENDHLLHGHESESYANSRSDSVDPSFGHNVVQRTDHIGGTETKGNGNLVITGQNVNINKVYLFRGEGSLHENPEFLLPQEITNNNARPVTVPNDPDVRHEPMGEDAWATQTTSRQTFPTPVSGIKYVTSMSPPLMSQASDHRIPSSAAHPHVRRQSSEISSTSAGPVENQIEDGVSSSCQDSIPEVCAPPIHQYNSRRLDSNWSRMISQRGGPVQHESCNRFVPFRGPVRQFSDEDSSISIARPSESDCKGLY